MADSARGHRPPARGRGRRPGDPLRRGAAPDPGRLQPHRVRFPRWPAPARAGRAAGRAEPLGGGARGRRRDAELRGAEPPGQPGRAPASGVRRRARGPGRPCLGALPLHGGGPAGHSEVGRSRGSPRPAVPVRPAGLGARGLGGAGAGHREPASPGAPSVRRPRGLPGSPRSRAGCRSTNRRVSREPGVRHLHLGLDRTAQGRAQRSPRGRELSGFHPAGVRGRAGQRRPAGRSPLLRCVGARHPRAPRGRRQAGAGARGGGARSGRPAGEPPRSPRRFDPQHRPHALPCAGPGGPGGGFRRCAPSPGPERREPLSGGRPERAAAVRRGRVGGQSVRTHRVHDDLRATGGRPESRRGSAPWLRSAGPSGTPASTSWIRAWPRSRPGSPASC